MVDKTKMKDKMGRYITQGLFLELGYSDFAIYTLEDEDKEYKGRTYPSIKKLYIEYADLEEYDFSKEYFVNWQHWQRLLDNKAIFHHIEQWREELMHSLRGEALKKMIDIAHDTNSFQATKYLIEKGWMKKQVGRPTNEEVSAERERQARLKDEYSSDISLLAEHRKK